MSDIVLVLQVWALRRAPNADATAAFKFDSCLCFVELVRSVGFGEIASFESTERNE